MVNINAANRDTGKSYHPNAVWYKISTPWCFIYTIVWPYSCGVITTPFRIVLHHIIGPALNALAITTQCYYYTFRCWWLPYCHRMALILSSLHQDFYQCCSYLHKGLLQDFALSGNGIQSYWQIFLFYRKNMGDGKVVLDIFDEHHSILVNKHQNILISLCN